MPLLVVIIIVLCIRSLTLDGASAGLKFLFYPDFTKLTGEGILSALGHAFFSLSLGMGTLITYGSYIRKDNNLAKTALQVTIADTMVAILAGVAIFPAVFAFGIEPSSGPGLVFITLPNVFHQMPGGSVFAVLFFILLSVAALTSSISILEVIVAFFKEELQWSRHLSTLLAVLLTTFFGILCSLSFGNLKEYTVLGQNIFDLFDHISANILLPLGGLFIALFVGWKLGLNIVVHELSKGSKPITKLVSVFMILIKVIAPIAIAIIFIYNLFGSK
jgi:neurotransmitter:Na+ symporter, NSS family